MVEPALKLGDKLISALPPAFLMLVLLNLGFLGMTYWFIDHQLQQRMELANKILDGCIAEMRE